MKPCNSCACLLQNKDKIRLDAAGENWYNQNNINRLWKEIQVNGAFLACHSTDPNAANYGGEKNIKAGKITACVGVVIYMYMHIKIYEYFEGNYNQYKNCVGKNVALNAHAMLNIVFDMARGKSGLIGPGLIIPTTFDGDLNALVYPTGFERTIKKYLEIYCTENIPKSGD